MSGHDAGEPEAGLLAGQPGTYWLPGSAAEVSARLADSGWRTATVGPATDRRDFYRQIAVALEFPSYFGSNLDALWDCLTDLTDATALVWAGWRTLPATRPEDWRQLLEVLTDRTQVSPRFAVVMVDDLGPGPSGPR